MRKVIGTYMKWKYEADKNLVKRDEFKWTILRPGGLTDQPGKGTASIGRTHLSPTISVSAACVYVIETLFIVHSEMMLRKSSLCWSIAKMLLVSLLTLLVVIRPSKELWMR